MKLPSILCVIPSRIGSTRLPRKPLLPLAGKPMVQWAWENACACPAFHKVVVATDAQEIAQVIQAAGGEVAMTHPDVRTGSDRAAAVAAAYPDYDIIVNLQGDEPFIRPNMLSALVAPYTELDVHPDHMPDSATLARPFLHTHASYQSPHVVKVVRDRLGNALYFSRAPIPHFRAPVEQAVYQHMGLYAFKRNVLLRFTQLEQTPLERAELLEQLRLLENGYKMRVSLVHEESLEVNTPEEYEAAKLFAESRFKDVARKEAEKA